MKVPVGLGDDSVEVPVSPGVSREDCEVILVLSTVLLIYGSAVSLQPEDRLDACLKRSFLELEMRAYVSVLGQGSGRVP